MRRVHEVAQPRVRVRVVNTEALAAQQVRREADAAPVARVEVRVRSAPGVQPRVERRVRVERVQNARQVRGRLEPVDVKERARRRQALVVGRVGAHHNWNCLMASRSYQYNFKSLRTTVILVLQ